MNFDILFWLLWATIVCGLISLVDIFLWKPARGDAKMPYGIEQARGFFPVLLVVLIIRSFIFQPFKVPSESLEPTLLPGDFLYVNQYHYGLRLPVWHNILYRVHEPRRGDIMVFRWPVSENINFVKRVIGVPGDIVSYKNKILTVNGVEAKQTFIDIKKDNKFGIRKRYREDLLGVTHDIYLNDAQMSLNFANFKVPEGYYFMMGDNRDHSDDSRYWGLVPERNIIGQATRIWLSLDPDVSYAKIPAKLRFSRIGTKLYS